MGNLDSKGTDEKIILEKRQKSEFTKLFKVGIYKELHKKGFLTDLELRKIVQ